MAFVSLYEARQQKMRGPGKKGKYDLLAYSSYEYTSGKKYGTLVFTQKLLIKANLAIGDYVDILIEPTTGEVIVQKVLNGGWMLYKPSKKNINGTARLQFPVFDYGFPIIKGLTEIKHLHINSKGIVFNIKQVQPFITSEKV